MAFSNIEEERAITVVGQCSEDGSFAGGALEGFVVFLFSPESSPLESSLLPKYCTISETPRFEGSRRLWVPAGRLVAPRSEWLRRVRGHEPGRAHRLKVNRAGTRIGDALCEDGHALHIVAVCHSRADGYLLRTGPSVRELLGDSGQQHKAGQRL